MAKKRGPKSGQNQRAGAIVDLLRQEGEVSVEMLTARLHVTGMTIRRDLQALERDGLITRTHGGCVLRNPLTPFVEELPFAQKDKLRYREKCSIAAEVLELIEPGMSVYLDTGTTAIHLVRLLPEDFTCSVFTNNLCAALELFSRPHVQTVVFGGTLAAGSPDLFGEEAQEAMQRYAFDLAILGADALDLESGEIFSADLATANLSRAAQERSGRVVVALDSTKIGKTSRAVVRRLQAGDILVSDDELADEKVAALSGYGVTLRVAGSPGVVGVAP